MHDSVNVSCTFRTADKNCTVSTRENSHLNQKIHAAKHKLKRTTIAHVVKTNEENTESPSKCVRLDCDNQVQTLHVNLQTPTVFQKQTPDF